MKTLYTKKLWIQTKSSWIKSNMPNSKGWYECYLCGELLDPHKEVTLDHVLPKSKFPELMYQLDNLKPCCSKCNSDKKDKYEL